jgi:hypothetical protein
LSRQAARIAASVRATAGLGADEGDGDTVAATLRGNNLRGRHARLLLQKAFDVFGIDQEGPEPQRVAKASVIDEARGNEPAQVAGAEKIIRRGGFTVTLYLLTLPPAPSCDDRGHCRIPVIEKLVKTVPVIPCVANLHPAAGNGERRPSHAAKASADYPAM